MKTEHEFFAILHRFPKWETGRWDMYPGDSCPLLFRKKIDAKAKQKKIKAADSLRMMRIERIIVTTPRLDG